MPGVFVVTDSSCDLEQDDIDPFNIEIVPLTIRFGSEEFTDRQDLSVEDFYQRMANTEDLPQTACPSPGAFEQAFRNARDADADGSGLSHHLERLVNHISVGPHRGRRGRGTDCRPCDRQPDGVKRARHSCA